MLKEELPDKTAEGRKRIIKNVDVEDVEVDLGF